MLKRFALVFAALAVAVPLSACETMSATESPAPLASTTVDSTALITADKAFSAAIDVIHLIPASVLPPGSEKAKAVAKAIRTVDAALNAASSFAAAGETASYEQALKEAQAGIAELQRALK